MVQSLAKNGIVDLAILGCGLCLSARPQGLEIESRLTKSENEKRDLGCSLMSKEIEDKGFPDHSGLFYAKPASKLYECIAHFRQRRQKLGKTISLVKAS